MAGAYPKREKKKAETRKKIVAASVELFFERGATDGDYTLEDVAKRAGVHVQTLYRHFPNRTSLMIAGDEMWLERFENYLETDGVGLDTFTMWRNWLNVAFRRFPEDTKKFRSLYQRKAGLPSVMLGLIGVGNKYEDLLCEGLARDFQMPGDGISLPRLVAGMLMAGHTHVIRRFTEEETDFMKELNEAVDLVEEQFKHLLVEQKDKVTA